MDSPYPRLEVSPKTGDERFHDGGLDAGFGLLSFWRWSASDLVSNTTRGVLAEYIVAKALGIEEEARDGWAAYDFKTKSGIKVEVKSAAYVQSWAQRHLSAISFRTRKNTCLGRGYEFAGRGVQMAIRRVCIRPARPSRPRDDKSARPEPVAILCRTDVETCRTHAQPTLDYPEILAGDGCPFMLCRC